MDYVYDEWFRNTTYSTAHRRESPYAVIEYYDNRCSLNPPEMDIYVPIRTPPDIRFVDVPPFEAVCYRAIGNDLAKLKYEAFDVMLHWVEKYLPKGEAPFKLGVRYGETEEYESFCEVFYRLAEEDKIKDGMNTGKVKLRGCAGGTYVMAGGVHHFLEKDWGSFMRRLQQQDDYSPTGERYEEYTIEHGKVDYYTNIHFFERIVPN